MKKNSLAFIFSLGMLFSPGYRIFAGNGSDILDWQSLGTGAFTDDILSSFGVHPHIMTWEVEIQSSPSNPGLYRVVNPWFNGKCPYNLVAGEVYDTHEYDIVIHAEDPDHVYFENALSPKLFDGVSHDYTSFPWIYMVKYGKTFEDLVSDPSEASYFGKLEEGVISFPMRSLTTITEETENGIRGEGCNNSGLTSVTLPGFDVKGYTVKITPATDYLVDDTKIPFKMEIGSDLSEKASRIVWFIALWQHTNDMSTYEAYSSALDETVKDYEPGKNEYVADLPIVDFVEDGLWKGWYTIVALALDADGIPISGDAQPFYYSPKDKADDWQTIGEATLSGDWLPEISNIFYPGEYKAEIEENKDAPGLFRIVNPFATVERNFLKDADHDYYMHIDARDPDKVVLNESIVGLDYGFSSLILRNMAYSYLTEAEILPDDMDKYYGKFDTEKRLISFPEDNIVVNDVKGYRVNYPNSAMTIDIPKPNSILNEYNEPNAAIEYYDMQGIRIANPDNQSIYIKKEGSKVTKVISRR